MATRKSCLFGAINPEIHFLVISFLPWEVYQAKFFISYAKEARKRAKNYEERF